MSNIQFSSEVSAAARRDIVDLQQKIDVFSSGAVSDEAFRKFRLSRGVYGQRQPGVQMIRIKLPYGRITADQLITIANCSDQYATGNLHATTRQDIQLHFVKLAESPQLWADLEAANITLREACGNTVRNVTASAKAGIDPDEPFDVTPHAHAIFEYFLRNPICQDMGRKFKIALSSSHKDSAFAFMHDVGLIPAPYPPEGEFDKIPSPEHQNTKSLNDNDESPEHQNTKTPNKEKRGFKVLVGGGLGAQPFLAQTAYEFLEEEKVIPFIEAALRVFDRYGERVRRNKARMKFLLQDIGLERFMELVNEEWTALKNKEWAITTDEEEVTDEYSTFNIQYPTDPIAAANRLNIQHSIAAANRLNNSKLNNWLQTNVFEQKQKGYFGVQLRVLLGDMSSDTARALAAIVKEYAADDIRVTVNQGYLLRFVKPENLPALYEKLNELGLAEPGFDTTSDITTCPGTDTCNLAITSSYGITRELEKVMKNEFPDLIYNNDIKIKISGCMNGCGQHSIANIGFHGSSIKNGAYVLPALQVLLGGGFNQAGEATTGDKILKVPTKRGPECLRVLLNDYDQNALDGEYFNDYFVRQEDKYFYHLLKPIADPKTLESSDYVDWDHTEAFKTEIGIGECAGVMIDLVATTLIEAEEKLGWSQEALQNQAWADAIYHAYSSFVTAAKAALTAEGINCNSQHGIVSDFDRNFLGKPDFSHEEGAFKSLVFSINKNEPTEAFARYFSEEAAQFLQNAKAFRLRNVAETGAPQLSFLEAAKDS